MTQRSTATSQRGPRLRTWFFYWHAGRFHRLKNWWSWLVTGSSLHELWGIYEDGQSAYDPDAERQPEPPPHVWCSPVRLKAWRDGVESARRYEVDTYYSRLDAGEGSLLGDDMWDDIRDECVHLGFIDQNGRTLPAAEPAY